MLEVVGRWEMEAKEKKEMGTMASFQALFGHVGITLVYW